ncbi:hypothetical protein N9924_00795, partial [bacterium]|nr:hypothetical protein [bacterium]
MGIEVAIAALVISTVTGAQAASKQRKAGRAQAAAQKEASETQTAIESARDVVARRQQVREERVRRAQILQTAETTGTTGSSGAVGAVSALTAQQDVRESFLTGAEVGATAI